MTAKQAEWRQAFEESISGDDVRDFVRQIKAIAAGGKRMPRNSHAIMRALEFSIDHTVGTPVSKELTNEIARLTERIEKMEAERGPKMKINDAECA